MKTKIRNPTHNLDVINQGFKIFAEYRWVCYDYCRVKLKKGGGFTW